MSAKKKHNTPNEPPTLETQPLLTEVHSAKTAQEHFVEQYHTCHLCGTALEFTHVTHFLDDVVVEETSCPGCMVKAKTKNHILQ